MKKNNVKKQSLFSKATCGRKKFDMSIRPCRPNIFWHLLEKLVAVFLYVPARGKVKKVNCDGLKGPYLLLCNHASMIDFALAVKCTGRNRTNWVCSIEEFIGKEYVFRELGIIYKRKFTNDVTVVRHVLHALKKLKDVVVIYPEARFSPAGINERIDNAIGKLVKVAKCPVVTLTLNGNFLRSPQWNKHPYRDIQVTGVMEQIVTLEEAESLSAEEIQARIYAKFNYDEYKWQAENKIEIKNKERATNLHKILYQCPHCKKEYTTYSKGTKIWCEHCGKVWELDTYGQLHCENGEDIFTCPSDWYRWERQNVREEVRSGKYRFEDEARCEHLVTSKKGFQTICNVQLTHDCNGFSMKGEVDGKPFEYHRDPVTMSSCHIEYDYKNRGQCIELCTPTETYFVYPLNATNPLTKLHFATEEVYDYAMEQKENN